MPDIRFMKWTGWINLLFFFFLIFVGIYFGKERCLLFDGSLSVFVVAEEKAFPICDYRYTAGINSILPLMVSMAGGQMQYILYAYILNYLLLPVLVFFFMSYKDDSHQYQTAYLVGMSLFCAEVYFYPVHDYWAGYYLLFILYRLLEDKRLGIATPFKYVLSYILLILILFSHMNTFVSLGFLLAYLFAKQVISLRHLLLKAALIVIFLYVKYYFLLSPYEQQTVGSHSINIRELMQVFSSLTFTEFVNTLAGRNLNFLLLLLLVSSLLFRSKLYMVQGILLLNILFVVVMISYFFADYGYLVYTEGYLKSGTILLAIVVTERMYTSQRRRVILPFLLGFNYLFMAVMLLPAGRYHENRYALIAGTCKNWHSSMLLETNADMSPFLFTFFSAETSIINMVENNANYYANFRIRNNNLNIENQWDLAVRERGYYFDLSAPYTTIDADSAGISAEAFSYYKKLPYNYLEHVLE